MSASSLRVISLLLAATEIVTSLGMLDVLRGVSHECGQGKRVIFIAETPSRPELIA